MTDTTVSQAAVVTLAQLESTAKVSQIAVVALTQRGALFAQVSQIATVTMIRRLRRQGPSVF